MGHTLYKSADTLFTRNSACHLDERLVGLHNPPLHSTVLVGYREEAGT